MNSQEQIDRMWERNIDKIDRMSASDNLIHVSFANGFWFALALIARQKQLETKREDNGKN